MSSCEPPVPPYGHPDRDPRAPTPPTVYIDGDELSAPPDRPACLKGHCPNPSCGCWRPGLPCEAFAGIAETGGWCPRCSWNEAGHRYSGPGGGAGTSATTGSSGTTSPCSAATSCAAAQPDQQDGDA